MSPSDNGRPASSPAVHVLVAAGSSPTSRRTLRGELVWIPLPCGRGPCSCRADFTGATTRGITDVAMVYALDGTTRREVRRALTASMCRDCNPPSVAPTEAEKLLRFADAHPVGTLVRRGPRGEILAFPSGARMTADGRVLPAAGER